MAGTGDRLSAMSSSTPEPPNGGSALVPAILSVLAGLTAYAAGKQAVQSWEQIMQELQIGPKLAGALAAVAQKALQQILSRTTSTAARAALVANMQQVVDTAVSEGTQVVAQAARAIVEDLIEIRHAGKQWTEKVSPAGDKFDAHEDPAKLIKTAVDPTRLRSTAQDLSRRTHQAVWSAAEFHAAGEAGWPRVEWRSKRDAKVRSSHAILDGQSTALGTPFITYAGNEIRFPGDPLAPIEETANCRCFLLAHH